MTGTRWERRLVDMVIELISCTEDENVRQRARSLVKEYYAETIQTSERGGAAPTQATSRAVTPVVGTAARPEIHPQSIRADLEEFVETPERLYRTVYEGENLP